MKKIATLIVALFAGVLVLTGCESRSVDVKTTGAIAVPGAEGLYYFCHGPTLVYVSIWEDRADEYEAMWPGWCILTPDGKWVYPVTQPELFPMTPSNTDGNVQDDGDN